MVQAVWYGLYGTMCKKSGILVPKGKLPVSVPRFMLSAALPRLIHVLRPLRISKSSSISQVFGKIDDPCCVGHWWSFNWKRVHLQLVESAHF